MFVKALIKNLTPVALFVYNRPEHTQRTLDALSINDGASETDLYIFSDGPKTLASNEQLEKINHVRSIIKSIRWAKSVTIIEQKENKGLADSIINGVNKVVDTCEAVIVLEDDVIVSKGFLNYMNAGLSLYKDNTAVMHISAYLPPLGLDDKEQTIFINITHCWGWATWKRAWKFFNSDAAFLKDAVLRKDPFLQEFNFDNTGDFWSQLSMNAAGALNTWAIKWHASVFLNNGLCLHPYKSITHNIGADGTGTHFKTLNTSILNQEAIDSVNVIEIPTVENSFVRQRTYEYYCTLKRKQSIFDFFKKKIPAPIQGFLRRKLSERKNPITKELIRISKIPTSKIFSTLLFGYPITVQNSVGFIFLYKELFEQNIYLFESDTDSPRIIDCGANIGISIIYFKSIYPKAQIIAFEADPRIYAICEQNIKSLGFDNIQLKNFALWDTEGELTFNTDSNDAGRVLENCKENNTIKVQSRKLSSYLCKKTDFLKLDIEGAEVKVIKECGYLLKNVKALFIEYHSFVGEVDYLPEILQILRNNNFDFYLSTPYVVNKLPLYKKRYDGNIRSLVNIQAVQKGVL